MTRYGRIVRLRPEKLDEYRRLHDAVWPAVLDALRRAGVRNYTIFHHAGLLFSVLEYAGHDWDADRRRLLADPDMIRWNELTGPCVEPLEPAGPTWVVMEELFHMD